MIRIGKRLTFAASHVLWNNDWTPELNHEVFGKCSTLHGHNYVVEVDIEGTTNQDDGMVVNYDVLKDVINSIDHKHLNDVIDYHPLTAENICQWLRIQLNSAFLDQGRTAEVIRVLVKETESSYAEWTR